MALIRCSTSSGGGGGGGIDFSNADVTDTRVVSSGTYSIAVTQKPKYIIMHTLVKNNYSYTYMYNVNTETGWRIGTEVASVWWVNEATTYSNMIASATSSSVTFKTTEYSGYSTKVITKIYY